MQRNFNSTNSQLDKVMTEEQFEQIVEAIVSGKYSWACLLILRFSGYNPLHYIPYRTYNRLMKHQEQVCGLTVKDNRMSAPSKSGSTHSRQSSTKLRDLCYVEDIDRQSKSIKGGRKAFSFSRMSNLILHKLTNN